MFNTEKALELMRKNGLLNEDLAKATHVDKSMISRILTGGKIPSWPLVCAIADILGCATDDLRKR